MPSGARSKISLVRSDYSEAGVSAFVLENPPFLKQFSIVFSETHCHDIATKCSASRREIFLPTALASDRS
jgi:hypothetical protein